MNERIQLDSQDAGDDLRERFDNFYDGLILGFSATVAWPSAEKSVRVQLNVKDDHGVWFGLTFDFAGVRRFLFEESPKSYNAVLSDGVMFHVDDDGVIADLWPLPGGDVWKPDDIDRAGQYVVAKACTVEIAEEPSW